MSRKEALKLAKKEQEITREMLGRLEGEQKTTSKYLSDKVQWLQILIDVAKK